MDILVVVAVIDLHFVCFHTVCVKALCEMFHTLCCRIVGAVVVGVILVLLIAGSYKELPVVGFVSFKIPVFALLFIVVADIRKIRCPEGGTCDDISLKGFVVVKVVIECRIVGKDSALGMSKQCG